MTLISPAVWDSFVTETTKIAAPRQVREVRKLFQRGEVDKANALIKSSMI